MYLLHISNLLIGDIKPANIVSDADGNSFIIDWGHAHFVEEYAAEPSSRVPTTPSRGRTRSSTRESISIYCSRGSSGYAAPDHDISSAMDIWSCGKIFAKYACYEGDLATDLVNKMLRSTPNRRISAEDALQHPYFTSINPS